MTLRVWQQRCLEEVFVKFSSGQRHFLCLATPGAGKTRMAAEVAKNLLEQNKVDFVFCFSPSISTAKGMRDTLEATLGISMSGLIGSKGVCVTYQSLNHKDEYFWDMFRQHKVFAIFDEIHHCGGNEIENANVWAMHILRNIHSNASYTLALTGTPWRSDSRPVTLSRYDQVDGNLYCDFEYGLAEAIKDGVCRIPKITAVDNNNISVAKSIGNKTKYTSIKDMLENGSVSYQSIVENETVIDFCISEANKQLTKVRKYNPSAAGLVVASSVAHAELIAEKLKCISENSVSIVSYKNPFSEELINTFQRSQEKWLVSVGMVSEGTDIPRLQVCCHLTRIKTELHFRQILGRIIRMTQNDLTHEAYLYSPAQPQLIEYAQRLHRDIPEEVRPIKTLVSTDSVKLTKKIEGTLDEKNIKTTESNGNTVIKAPSNVTSPNRLQTSLLDNYINGLLFEGEFSSRYIEACFLSKESSIKQH
ncbi:MAG: superfamily II DNA or RNA helicase [Glaciecola sp.]|jgi:superfamily II DNA or RNA helicase